MSEEKITIGDVAMAAIKDGATNEDALEKVKAKFPEANTSLASINWYRQKLRQTDKSIPTARDLKKKAKEEASALDS